MDDKNFLLDVAKKIDSGEYFEDARDWHYTQYLSYVVDRNYLITFFVITLCLGTFAGFMMPAYFPLAKKFPINVVVSDMTTDYSYFTLMGAKKETADEELIRNLATRYVKKRESFYPDTFKRNMNYVKNISKAEIAAEIEDYTNPDNPNSPLVKYETGSQRIIDLVASSYRMLTPEDDASIPHGEKKATIRYRAILQTQTTDEISYWESDVFFVYNDILYDDDEKKFSSLKFEVTDYKTRKRE